MILNSPLNTPVQAKSRSAHPPRACHAAGVLHTGNNAGGQERSRGSIAVGFKRPGITSIRDYQRIASEQLCIAPPETKTVLGYSNIDPRMLVAHTGSGKTVMKALDALIRLGYKEEVLEHITKLLLETVQEPKREQKLIEIKAMLRQAQSPGGKIVFLVNKDLMHRQIPQTLLDLVPARFRKELSAKMQIIRGKKDLENVDKDAQIYFITYGSLYHNINEDKVFGGIPWGEVNTIYSDEAHHDCTDSHVAVFKNIFKHRSEANLAVKEPKPLQLKGVTATPLRHTPTATPLSAIYPADTLIRTTSMLHLIESGYLKRPIGHRIVTDKRQAIRIDPTTGEFNKSDMKALARDEGENAKLVQYYKQIFLESGKKRALVVAHDITHVESLYQRFKEAGIRVGCLVGPNEKNVDCKYWDGSLEVKGPDNQKVKEDKILSNREDKLNMLNRQHFGKKFDVLISCQMLRESLDVPQAHGVIFASVTRSIPELTQILGRGMRIDPKEPETKDMIFMYLGANDGQRLKAAALPNLGNYQDNTLIERIYAPTTERTATQRRVTDNSIELVSVENPGVDLSNIGNPWRDELVGILKRGQDYLDLDKESAINLFVEKFCYQLDNISPIIIHDILSGNAIDHKKFRSILSKLASDGHLKAEEQSSIINRYPELAGIEAQEFKAKALTKFTERPSHTEFKDFIIELSIKTNLSPRELVEIAGAKHPSDLLNILWGSEYIRAKILNIHHDRPKRGELGQVFRRIHDELGLGKAGLRTIFRPGSWETEPLLDKIWGQAAITGATPKNEFLDLVREINGDLELKKLFYKGTQGAFIEAFTAKHKLGLEGLRSLAIKNKHPECKNPRKPGRTLMEAIRFELDKLTKLDVDAKVK